MKASEERENLENNSTDNNLEKDSEFFTEKNNDQVIDDDIDMLSFGWSSYSETTNGRFAMIGFLAIILIEIFSKQSFLKWAGIL